MENVVDKKPLIKGLLLDGVNDPKVVEIKDDLHAYYSLLDCDLIEIVRRRIPNTDHHFVIVCDEEGLLKERTIAPSGIAFNETEDEVDEILLGKIFICNDDEEGNLLSLKDDEIEEIKKCVKILDKDFPGRDMYGNEIASCGKCLHYAI